MKLTKKRTILVCAGLISLSSTTPSFAMWGAAWGLGKNVVTSLTPNFVMKALFSSIGRNAQGLQEQPSAPFGQSSTPTPIPIPAPTLNQLLPLDQPGTSLPRTPLLLTMATTDNDGDIKEAGEKETQEDQSSPSQQPSQQQPNGIFARFTTAAASKIQAAGEKATVAATKEIVSAVQPTIIELKEHGKKRIDAAVDSLTTQASAELASAKRTLEDAGIQHIGQLKEQVSAIAEKEAAHVRAAALTELTTAVKEGKESIKNNIEQFETEARNQLNRVSEQATRELTTFTTQMSTQVSTQVSDNLAAVKAVFVDTGMQKLQQLGEQASHILKDQAMHFCTTASTELARAREKGEQLIESEVKQLGEQAATTLGEVAEHAKKSAHTIMETTAAQVTEHATTHMEQARIATVQHAQKAIDGLQQTINRRLDTIQQTVTDKLEEHIEEQGETIGGLCAQLAVTLALGREALESMNETSQVYKKRAEEIGDLTTLRTQIDQTMTNANHTMTDMRTAATAITTGIATIKDPTTWDTVEQRIQKAIDQQTNKASTTFFTQTNGLIAAGTLACGLFALYIGKLFYDGLCKQKNEQKQKATVSHQQTSTRNRRTNAPARSIRPAPARRYA